MKREVGIIIQQDEIDVGLQYSATRLASSATCRIDRCPEMGRDSNVGLDGRLESAFL